LNAKIKWARVTKFLKVTNSTPQQLLDWLEEGFKNKHAFICNSNLYLGKYYLYDSVVRDDVGNDIIVKNGYYNRTHCYVPTLITNTLFMANLWNSLNTDKEFRKDMIDKFKKHYKLK
jgi:hypothetical protein